MAGFQPHLPWAAPKAHASLLVVSPRLPAGDSKFYVSVSLDCSCASILAAALVPAARLLPLRSDFPGPTVPACHLLRTF